MLEKIIGDIIAEKSYITVSNFIQLALYHPEFGYYQKKNPFGLGGDFVTAPQISSIFNEMFALYFIYQFRKKYKQGDRVIFAEFGAGNGFFMRDFLTVASKVPEFFNNVEVVLVEISETLIAEQKRILSGFEGKVNLRWERDVMKFLGEIPEGPDTLFFGFSNEFFDAFPISQYIKNGEDWNEIVVTKNKEGKLGFGFTEHDFSPEIGEFLEVLGTPDEAVRDGEIFEVSCDVIEVFSLMCKKVRAMKGSVVTVDYGFLQTEFTSTLQSLKNHERNDVLENIGEADITFLVNFEMLYHIAIKAGVTAFPPVTQKEFLESIGMREKVKMLLEREKDDAKRLLIEASTERILSAAQMGELFKVLIVEN